MMKILYYQCFSGIKGEMNLAAMLSLGVDLSYVIKQLNLLKLNHTYQIKHHEERRKGIKGIKIDVQINSDLQSNSNCIIHANRHECFHDKNDANDIGDFNGKYNAISGEKCTLSEIQRIITASGLSPKVQSKSLHAFTKWAEAEATVRGITKEHVYLHEMDAIKAIIHIVGAAICLEYLKVDKVCASRVELGGGFVQSEQGLSPVPRPVVLELVKGMPISMGNMQVETTTPIGAAILAANVDEFSEDQKLVIEKVGYGLGEEDSDIPHVLRVILGTQEQNKQDKNPAQLMRATQYMIETNIDDMNPEFFYLVEERLFEAGALDVFKTPIMMKKGRPAIQLSVLANNDDVSTMEEIILRNTTAIGLRKYPVDKVMLPRQIEEIQTKYGKVAIKVCYLDGQRIKAKPEFEDCKRIAKENNLTLSEIYEEINFKN